MKKISSAHLCKTVTVFFYLGMFFLNLSTKNRNFYSEFPCIFPQLIYQQKKAKYVSQKRRLRLLPTDPHNILSFCAWNLRKIKMAVGHLFQFSGELPRCGYNRLCNNVILLQNVFPYLTYFVVLNNALNEFHGIVYIK